MSALQELLDILKESGDNSTQLFSVGDGCYLLSIDPKLWKLWPREGSWIEVDSSGTPIGEMHYGAISNFIEKHVKRNDFLPTNHSKKWSTTEKNKLVEFIDSDKPVSYIAKKLGRTKRSVVAKSADIMGVNLDLYLVKRITPNCTIKSLIKKQFNESELVITRAKNDQ